MKRTKNLKEKDFDFLYQQVLQIENHRTMLIYVDNWSNEHKIPTGFTLGMIQARYNHEFKDSDISNKK